QAQPVKLGCTGSAGQARLYRLSRSSSAVQAQPVRSATMRASTDLPEPGSPANTTRNVTQARYRPAPSAVLLPGVVAVLRGAAVLAGPDHLLEVAGQVAHVELGDALVPHVRFQAGGVQT